MFLKVNRILISFLISTILLFGLPCSVIMAEENISGEFSEIENVSSEYLSRMCDKSPLNRWPNYRPYRDNLVDLSNEHYINASPISGINHSYIATQAPFEETMDDFCRMLWEKNSYKIVTLGKEIDYGEKDIDVSWVGELILPKFFVPGDGHRKMFPYWNGSFTYKNFNLECISTKKEDEFIIERSLKLTKKYGDPLESRIITQYHFEEWPDRDAPKSETAISRLLDKFDDCDYEHPIVVHCSAGVGRTGTFCTLHINRDSILSERETNLKQIVLQLRGQRMLMVQKECQYEFCYNFTQNELIPKSKHKKLELYLPNNIIYDIKKSA